MFLRLALVLGLLFPALPGRTDTPPPTDRDRFKAAIALMDTDPPAGFAAMESLAADGYPRAFDRLGAFAQRGMGVPADMVQAVAYYETAIEKGYEKSLISLGKALIKMDRPADALRALTTAQKADLAGADVALAVAHATRGLGRASDPKQGWTTLSSLAQAGDRGAEINLLYVASVTDHQIDTAQPILESLTAKADAGDGRAAEMLLRYYRMVAPGRRATLRERERLAEHPGIRDRVRAEEQLYLAAINTPGQFWTASDAIVRPQTGDAFARGLVVTARINKNAYVRILQKELPPLGYGTGRASGYLTGRTLRAVLRFCRDTGIRSECKLGPLKSQAIKAIAAELTKARK